jgi:ABC-type antimicrobial peptide transport system permease subunit
MGYNCCFKVVLSLFFLYYIFSTCFQVLAFKNLVSTISYSHIIISLIFSSALAIVSLILLLLKHDFNLVKFHGLKFYLLIITHQL